MIRMDLVTLDWERNSFGRGKIYWVLSFFFFLSIALAFSFIGPCPIRSPVMRCGWLGKEVGAVERGVMLPAKSFSVALFAL